MKSGYSIESRDTAQRDKTSREQHREEAEMDMSGDSWALSQHQSAPERLDGSGDRAELGFEREN